MKLQNREALFEFLDANPEMLETLGEYLFPRSVINGAIKSSLQAKRAKAVTEGIGQDGMELLWLHLAPEARAEIVTGIEAMENESMGFGVKPLCLSDR